MPVIAACTRVMPSWQHFEARRIAIQHMTLVMFLSDGYIANGGALEPAGGRPAGDTCNIRTRPLKKETPSCHTNAMKTW